MTKENTEKYLEFVRLSREQLKILVDSGEIKRWLQNSAVIINGSRPKPEDVVDFPVTELIFFPNGQRRTTYVS